MSRGGIPYRQLRRGLANYISKRRTFRHSFESASKRCLSVRICDETQIPIVGGWQHPFQVGNRRPPEQLNAISMSGS